jgi:hypothetical protein
MDEEEDKERRGQGQDQSGESLRRLCSSSSSLVSLLSPFIPPASISRPGLPSWTCRHLHDAIGSPPESISVIYTA